MCHRHITSYVCERCKPTTRPMMSETVHCDNALRCGGICWYLDVRENVVEEKSCSSCHRAAPPIPFSQGLPPYVQTENTGHASYRQVYPQPCSAFPAYSTTCGAIYEHPNQYNGQHRGVNSQTEYNADPVEQYYCPTGSLEQLAQTCRRGDKSNFRPHVDKAPPYGHAPNDRPETYYQSRGFTPRYPPVPNSASDQAKAINAEEAEFQRALDQSRHEHQLNEVKSAYSRQGRRISALEERVALEEQKAEFDRERRQAEWEQYSIEKTASASAQSESNLFTSNSENRGIRPTGRKLQVIFDKAGKNKELWVGDIRKVNGRLYEYRKRLKPWEYEVLQRN